MIDVSLENQKSWYSFQLKLDTLLPLIGSTKSKPGYVKSFNDNIEYILLMNQFLTEPLTSILLSTEFIVQRKYLESNHGIRFNSKQRELTVKILDNTMQSIPHFFYSDAMLEAKSRKRAYDLNCLNEQQYPAIDEYSDHYIRHLYNSQKHNISVMCLSLMETIRNLCETDGDKRKDPLRLQQVLASYCINKIAEYFAVEAPHIVKDTQVDTIIVDNTVQFLNAVAPCKRGTRKIDMQRAFDTVFMASCYNIDVNSSDFSAIKKRLNISRKTELVTHKRSSQQLEQLYPTITTPPHNALITTPLQQRYSVDSLMTLLSPQRDVRKDAYNMSAVSDYQHDACPENTNAKQRFKVVSDTNGERAIHPVRIQEFSLRSLFISFFESDYYTMFRYDNPGVTELCFRKFAQVKCGCISFEKQNECADHICVQFQQFIEAYNRLRIQCSTNNPTFCGCTACANPLFRIASKAIENFMEFMLCGRVAHPALSSDNHAATLKEIQQIALENCLKTTPMKAIVQGTAKIETFRCVTPSAQRQLGTFKSHPKKCCDLQCNECGMAVLERNKCPREWSEITELTWHKYEDMDRSGGGKQKELVMKRTTHEEFMTEMYAFLSTCLPHIWHKRWDKQNRLVMCRNIDVDCIDIFVDFSANYSNEGQDTVTCATTNTTLQLVIIVHHSQKTLANGDKVMTNDSLHFWIKPEKNKLESNYSCYDKCIRHTIIKYKALFASEGRQLNKVWINSDGCSSQFKSRKNIFNLVQLHRDFKLSEIIHTFAPMGCFKCEVDSSGGFCKQWLRKSEQARRIRCPTAIEVYIAISKPMPDGMPPPKGNKHLMSLSNRYHRLVIDESAIGEAIALGLHPGEDPNIIISVFVDINPSTVTAITDFYQFRVSPTMYNNTNRDKHIVSHRLVPCFCANCIAGSFNLCPHSQETGPWIISELEALELPVPKQKDPISRTFEFYSAGGKPKPNKLVIIPSYDYEFDENSNKISDSKVLHFNLYSVAPGRLKQTICDATTLHRPINAGEQAITCKRLRSIGFGEENCCRYVIKDKSKYLIPLHCVLVPHATDPLHMHINRYNFADHTQSIENNLFGDNKTATVFSIKQSSILLINEVIGLQEEA